MAAAGPGFVAALLPLQIDLGLGWTLVALAGLVIVAVLPGHHRVRLNRQLLAVCSLLVLTGVVTAAAWAAVLCWIAAVGLLAIMLTRARTISGMLSAGVAASLAWLRGLP